MGLIFKNKRNTRNTSDNNINITTNTDIMFQIGQDLGIIKHSIDNNNHKLDKVFSILKEHDKRLGVLENGKNKKNNKNNFRNNI